MPPSPFPLMAMLAAKRASLVSALKIEPIRLLIAEETSMGCQLLSDMLRRSRLGLGGLHGAVTSSQIFALANENAIDVALISEDLQDGGAKGLEAVERLCVAHPHIRSIVLVRDVRPELTLNAFRSGAKGVFCRKDPIEALWKCIRVVHEGQIWLDTSQLEIILGALVEAKPIRIVNVEGACLTQREDQVSSLVAEGLTNREVAKRLGLSEHTVSSYLFKVYEKLGISRRVEFVLYYRQQHLNKHKYLTNCTSYPGVPS
jgi:two-component system nitrate/nitrite response regulator NarL